MLKSKLSHVNADNQPTMVDISHKNDTERIASASALIELPLSVQEIIMNNELITAKGAVIQTSILAGIMGAKKTADLIPLCHPLFLTKIDIFTEFPDKNTLKFISIVKNNGKTGVEMEALTAVTIASLTFYDMCKAISHDIIIKEIKLESKSGGKNDFKRT